MNMTVNLEEDHIPVVCTDFKPYEHAPVKGELGVDNEKAKNRIRKTYAHFSGHQAHGNSPLYATKSWRFPFTVTKA